MDDVHTTPPQANRRESLRRSRTLGIRPGDLVFDTRTFPVGDRFEAYRELFAPGGDVAVLDQGWRLANRTRLHGTIMLHERSVYGVEHQRDQPRIRRDAFDHFTLHAVRQGCVRVETATTQDVGPAEVILLDMTRPFRLLPNAEVVVLSVPRAIVTLAYPQPSALHGRRFDAFAAKPLTDWIDRLPTSETDANIGSSKLEEELSRALAAALHTSAQSFDRLARTEWDAVRRDRARQLVEDELDETALTPEDIAARTAMSRATLYRVFEPLGSIARWRQARRLWRFKAALTWSQASIAASAAEAGLTDAAYATALFVRTFGCTPSTYRQSSESAQASDDSLDGLKWAYANMPVMLARGRA